MNVVLASLLVLLAVANAALVDVVTLGTPQLGTLGVTLSTTQADYYKAWIPTTANNISVFFDVLGTDPCDLYLSFSYDVLPCGPSWDFYGTENYCDSGASYIEAWSSSHPKSASLDSKDSGFKVGTWAYFSVSRYYEDTDLDTICPYTFTIDTTNCAAGTVSLYSYDDDAYVCAPVTNVTFTAGAATSTITAGGNVKAYAMMVPANVGTLTIQLNTTSTSSFDLYAQSGSAASYYQHQYSGNSVDTGYYVLEAITPEAGWFYFTIEQGSGDTYDGLLTFSYNVCPAGFGGYNCTYPTMMFNATKYNGMAMQLSPNMTSYNNYGPFVYYYIDVPENTTDNLMLNISSQGSGYIYYRRNGYPEYSSSYGYQIEESAGDFVSFGLTWQNLYVGGRFFIGIQNTMSDSWLNYTFAGAVSAGTTSGTATTGTTATSTGTSTGTATTGIIVTGGTTGNDTDTTTTGMASSTTMSPDTTTNAAGVVGASVVVLALVLAAL